MLKVAVTGASGHIGNCLVRDLIKSGAKVKVLVHQDENDLANLGVEMINGNILEPESLMPFCKNADIVFHCAAIVSIDNRHKNRVYETNVTGTKNMLRASMEAGVKKFIHFSSIDAFQRIDREHIVTEETPLTKSKKSVYEVSKAKGELLVLEAVRNGLDAVILSPTAVVGPYDFRESFLGLALKKFYNNKIPALIPGGYNWVDVRDVVSAAIEAIQKGRKGEKYILAGHFYEIKDLSTIIGNISGRKPPRFMVPIFLAILVCPFFEIFALATKQKPMFTCQSLNLLIRGPRKISIEKAKRELNYSPHSLEQTLKDTFDWYKQNNYLN